MTMSELNLLLRNSDMPCGATALTAQVKKYQDRSVELRLNDKVIP